MNKSALNYLFRTLGQYEKALKDFSKAIELKPDFSKANNRGIAYKKLGQNERTLEDFNKAIELEWTCRGLL